MRYLTKEHFTELNNMMEYDLYYDTIEDKEYSEEDIVELVGSTKEESLLQMEEYYDTAPEMVDVVKEYGLNLEDIMIADMDENGEPINARQPESWEEFERYQELEHKANLLAFETRPPFDREDASREYDEMYETALSKDFHFLPDWVFDKVDMRILALNALPKSIHEVLSKDNETRRELYEQKSDEAMNLRKKNTNRALTKLLDEYLEDNYYLVSMEINPEGDSYFYLNDENKGIQFTDLKIIENELGNIKDHIFIYASEIYDTENGYEIHFLLDTEEGFKNLTITCTNFFIEKSAE